MLTEALAGSSRSGNLNMVSVIKSQNAGRKKRLRELHFGQPMVEQAPLVLTYMGTTLHSMGAIAEFLQMPDNCLPVTSLVVGYPDESPAQRDRAAESQWLCAGSCQHQHNRANAKMTDDMHTLRRILKACQTIAVWGLSAEWHRPSCHAHRIKKIQALP